MKKSGSSFHIKLQAVLSSSYRAGQQILESWFWQSQLRICIFLNALYLYPSPANFWGSFNAGNISWMGCFRTLTVDFKNRLPCCCLQSFHILFFYLLQFLGSTICLQVTSREPPLQKGKQDSCSHLTPTWVYCMWNLTEGWWNHNDFCIIWAFLVLSESVQQQIDQDAKSCF